MMSQTFDFRGEVLAEAVEMTFRNRSTPIESNPAVFESTFAKEGNKAAQWRGFITKAKLAGAPDDFQDAIAAIKELLEPLMASLVESREFHSVWHAPGAWR